MYFNIYKYDNKYVYKLFMHIFNYIICNLLVCNLFSLCTTILDMDMGLDESQRLHASTEANLGQLGKQHVFCVQITFVAT